jgi:hypothetical protein
MRRLAALAGDLALSGRVHTGESTSFGHRRIPRPEMKRICPDSPSMSLGVQD